MSSSLFDSPATLAEPEPNPVNTFDYQPVPILAPITLAIGVFSLFAFISVGGLPIALIGVIVGAICLLKILRSKGELGGRLFAISGFLLSVVAFVGGSTTQAFAYATEVPEGFERLNFTEDISKKGFIIENGYQTPHPAITNLDGKKIFLKGYMYPTRQSKGIRSFVFCRDSGDCCFGGTPKIEDMIVVNLEKEKTTELINGLTAVAGTFELRRDLATTDYTELTGANPVFEMTASLVEPARSSF